MAGDKQERFSWKRLGLWGIMTREALLLHSSIAEQLPSLKIQTRMQSQFAASHP